MGDRAVRTVTNGNILNLELMNLILKTQEIRFSVDTPNPETYAYMRRVNSSLFGKTIENLKTLVSEKRRTNSNLEIGATCIISHQNSGQVAEFADLMLGEVAIDHVIYKSDIYGNVKPGKNDLRIVSEQLSQIKEKYGEKVDIRPDLGEFNSGQPCVVTSFKSVINPYGEFFSCCLGAQPGEKNGYKYGDVKSLIREGESNPISTIWAETGDIRQEMKRRVGCTDCNFTDREINVDYLKFVR